MHVAQILRVDYSFALQFFVGGRPIVICDRHDDQHDSNVPLVCVDGASGYEILIQKAVLAPGEGPIVRQNNLGTTSFTLPSALGKGTYRVGCEQLTRQPEHSVSGVKVLQRPSRLMMRPRPLSQLRCQISC